MREMDLSGFVYELSSPFLDEPEFVDLRAEIILSRVMCYALWPNDEARRQGAAARFWAQTLADFEKSKLGQPGGDPLRQEIHDHLLSAVQGCVEQSFNLDGGWSALPLYQPIMPKEMKEAEGCLSVAGRILAVIDAISNAGHNRPSINLAIDILDKTNQINRTRSWKCWKTHKAVAHLDIAFAAGKNISPADGESETDVILSIARQFQNFAISAGHIKADEIWGIPADLILPNLEVVNFTLSDEQLNALKSYRAPQ